MTNFDKKSQEELVEIEFKNLEEYKRLEKGHIIGCLVLFGAIIMAFTFGLFDPGGRYFIFEVTIFLLWLGLGIIILDKLEKKRKKLFEQFKLTKS